MSAVDEREPLKAAGSSEEPAHSDDHTPLHCTDIMCLLVLIAFIAGMVAIGGYAHRHGDPRRLTRGIDWTGQFCGVDENVSSQPFLYWCGRGNKSGVSYDLGVPTDFNFRSPICVGSCPTDDSLTVYCPMPSDVDIIYTGDPPAITKTMIVVQEVAAQQTYPTTTFMNRYCIPHPDGENAETTKAIYDHFVNSTAIGDWSEELMQSIGSIRDAVWPLVATAIIGLILCLVYLFFVQSCGRPLFYIVSLGVALALLITGLAFLSTAYNWTGHQDDNPLFRHWPDDHAFIVSLCIAVSCLVVAFFLLTLLCCFSTAIDTALGCISAAADCLKQQPSLLLEPIIDVVLRTVLFVGLLNGFLWLVSTGDIRKENVAVIGGKEVSGVKRSFSYTEDEVYMLIYYVFGSFWLMELAHALGQFVVAYVVVLWYYTPFDSRRRKRTPWLPLPRAYCAAIVYHLGTLALGSFLIALCRIPQLLLGYFAKHAKEKGNGLLKCCLLCLKCCLDCFEQCLEYINQFAYVDVAINSNDFCTAARRSFEFLLHEAVEIVLLRGATIVYSLLGITFVTVSCAVLAYTLVDITPEYSDESSANHIPNPAAVGAAGGVIGCVVSMAFMLVLDQTADTLLYTYSWNKAHDPESVRHYAPPVLADLVARHSERD